MLRLLLILVFALTVTAAACGGDDDSSDDQPPLSDTWAIEQQAREIDVQRLLGHSTSAMLRRYTASYDAEKAAQAHASFSPGDRLGAAPVSVT